MDCVICGGSAKKVTENRIGHYRSETVNVQSELYRCEQCEEGFFTPEQAKAHNKAVKNEIRKKYGLLSPGKIAEIRNKAGLSQSELEGLLGTGDKVVVRWENGKVIQGSGQDNILRLIEHDPNTINLLRQIQKLRAAEEEKYRRKRRPNSEGLMTQAI